MKDNFAISIQQIVKTEITFLRSFSKENKSEREIPRRNDFSTRDEISRSKKAFLCVSTRSDSIGQNLMKRHENWAAWICASKKVAKNGKKWLKSWVFFVDLKEEKIEEKFFLKRRKIIWKFLYKNYFFLSSYLHFFN